ncbi:hypothetical protein EV294_11368 [Paenibacillus sp. BK033]|uniref:ORC-CDC6 family AAA ATPase n=1 Tax=Paenibacillus sp. BK033 TaxID=2512133 RepID=UPI001046A79A|nr:hypothetical protein [Paenibacillus sp. BK033]TCM89127.1 hypothetical protein EV294_11368 [Paenibacillus sp. BK033]
MPTMIKLDYAFFQHDAQARFDPETHINIGVNIDKYISSEGTNILIEGIRGSGKTHILKMINTRYLDNFVELRVLPIYLSMAEVAEFVSKEASLFRTHLYSALILKTIRTIKESNGKINLPQKSGIAGMLQKLGQLFGLTEEASFDTLINKIEDYANRLHQELLNNPSKISEMTKNVDEINASIDVKPFKVGGKASEESTYSIEYLTYKLAHLNASKFLTEFFRYLTEVLQLHHSLLLIDECSDLPVEAQIEVFRLFKLVRGGTQVSDERNFMYFMGGVYPPQATHYPSRRNGEPFDFEPGNDCSEEYLELDVQVDFYEEFFRNLLISRMKKFKPAHTSYNILDLFEDDRSFLTAAYAAHGLPRRFFEIIHQAYENLEEYISSRPSDDTKTYKIRLVDVNSAIDTIVTSNILSSNKYSKEDFTVLETIAAALRRRNKKVETEASTKENYVPINFYFSCPRSKEEKIGNLIAKGVFHNQSRTRSLKHTVAGIGGRGLVIMIDLAVSMTEGTIPTKNKALEYFRNDAKLSAKNGYEYCQTIDF